jgi:hypothetical protein
MRVDGVFPDGKPWAIEVTETATGYTCVNLPVTTPVIPPILSGFTTLIFNAGTQSVKKVINPGETQYFLFTVPAGFTTLSMNVSNVTQVANLDMVLSKGYGAIDGTLQLAVDYYKANPSLWGTPYYRDGTWAKIGTDFGGEGITLASLVKVGRTAVLTPVTADKAGFTVSIPGTYYVAVKNQGPVAATYYVYAKQ